MHFRIFISILGFVMSISPSLHAQPSWYGDEQKGWLWYKKAPTPKLTVEQQDEDQLPLDNRQPKPPLSYREKLKQARHAVDEVLAKAVLEPTLENVSQFMRTQNRVLDEASTFEKMWMMASVLSGGEVYRESDQPFPHHREIYAEKQDKLLDAGIRELAKTHGLFFVFKGSCPYCHKFVPVIKSLMEEYGFECKAISPNGETLEGFPEAVADNGTIALINPEGVYPALFLVNPTTRQVIPLSWGLVNLSKLKENFRTILQSLSSLSKR